MKPIVETKVKISHSKRLVPSQFDAMRGSNIHASMTANRVMLNTAEPNEKALKIWSLVDEWLSQNCKQYYFIADKRSHPDYRVYFSSIREMEEFIVWAKLKL